MRAKKIYEKVSFERGKDPKRAMEIGLFNKIKEAWEWVQTSPGIGSIGIEGYLGGFALVFHFSPMKPSTSLIEEVVNKYMGDYLQEPFIRHNEIWFPVKDEYKWVFREVYNDRYPDWPISESISFERGEDPKRTLDIGLKRKIINALKNIKHDASLFSIKSYQIQGETRYIFISGIARVSYINDLLKEYDIYHYFKDTIIDRIGKGDVELNTFVYEIKPEYREAFPNIEISSAKDIIEESINFKRGQDPKSALGIGIFPKLKELAEFLEKDLEWNGAEVTVNNDGTLEYICLAGNSVISEIKESIKKFGWDGMMKVNIDDDCSRSYEDCLRHFYKISFKKPFALKMGLSENVSFERRKDPKKTLGIGEYAIIKKGIKDIYNFRGVMNITIDKDRFGGGNFAIRSMMSSKEVDKVAEEYLGKYLRIDLAEHEVYHYWHTYRIQIDKAKIFIEAYQDAVEELVEISRKNRGKYV